MKLNNKFLKSVAIVVIIVLYTAIILSLVIIGEKNNFLSLANIYKAAAITIGSNTYISNTDHNSEMSENYNKGYLDGLQHASKGTVVYTLVHQHTGSESAGGGCYTTAHTSYTSCHLTGRMTGSSNESSSPTGKMYYFECSAGHTWGGWYTGDANSEHAKGYSTTYSLSCGKNDGDFIRTTTDYSSIQANEKISKVEIQY